MVNDKSRYRHLMFQILNTKLMCRTFTRYQQLSSPKIKRKMDQNLKKLKPYK